MPFAEIHLETYQCTTIKLPSLLTNIPANNIRGLRKIQMMRFISNSSRSIDAHPWLYSMLQVFEDGYSYISVISEFSPTNQLSFTLPSLEWQGPDRCKKTLPNFKPNDVQKWYLLKMIVILAGLRGIIPARKITEEKDWSAFPGEQRAFTMFTGSQKDLSKSVTLTSASKDECLQVWAASNTHSYTVHLDECNVKEHLVHSCLRWHLLNLPIIEPVGTSEVASAREVVPCWLLKRQRSPWIHQIFVATLQSAAPTFVCKWKLEEH